MISPMINPVSRCLQEVGRFALCIHPSARTVIPAPRPGASDMPLETITNGVSPRPKPPKTPQSFAKKARKSFGGGAWRDYVLSGRDEAPAL